MVKNWASPLLFNIALEFSAYSMMKQEKPRHPDWKGRSKAIFNHTTHKPVYRKYKEIYKEATGTNKWVLLGCKIQDRYTKIKLISIY